MDAYVARQPIFNRKKKIYAYELLFRDSTANFVPDIDGDLATGQVLSNSVINIGMEEIAGDSLSFINFTESLLLKRIPLLLPKEKIVVEILEDVKPTPELLEACREISAKGYLIALDDFIYLPELRPLIEMADIIKFDFRISTIAEITSYIRRLPNPGPKLLAEKIETNEEFAIALDLGFDFFQGYFFCRPEIIKGRQIETTQLSHLEIVALLHQDAFEFAKLDELVSRDVGISYKLLRYINSPFFARLNKISTIKQALVYMGKDELQRFMSLIAISNLSSGKPHELINLACIRGKFCELLAQLSQKRVKSSELFTVGIFSLLDAIMDQPMHEIISKIPLSENIALALIQKKGLLAAFLILVIAYEQGRWALVKELADKLAIPEAAIPDLYLEACRWSNSVSPKN
ncbi:MAG: HDOD domain-containing protein [Deltaproteobacteria bacterium]|nr:HDOD domain-containing protein [Deltaproteobacteria bacterium]